MKTRSTFFIFLCTLFSALAVAQTVQVEINRTVKRYLNDVSELDRSNFFNLHGNSNDSDLASFYSTYDVGRGRQFWGPYSFAKQKTGEVGEYPAPKSGNDDLRGVGRFIATEHPANAFKDLLNVDKAGEWAVEYWKNFVDDGGRPEFFEVMNEPFVHASEYYQGGYNATKNAAIVTQMSELYASVGKAINEAPALANMKVIGYSAAWPSLEINNFEHWESYQKKFMDIAGEHMHAFATHLYDGINVSGQNNRRSGSNSEAILDLIETYSYAKWGVVKPHAISEYGGIEQGFGDDYSDLRNIQAVKSINHILFNLLEREENMAISIPFITDKSTWHINANNNYQPYNPALFKPSNIGEPNPTGWVFTPRINFYKLWKDFKGHRVFIKTDNPDIQIHALADGKQLHVALSNLDDFDKKVNLKLWSGLEGLENVNVKSLRIYDDKLPDFIDEMMDEALGSIDLIPGETAVITYNFADEIPVEKEVVQKKYYSENHIAEIELFNTEKFNFSGVEVENGYASLRMSISRKHDRSKQPQVTINGTEVAVPSNWQGYDQANRDDFFGMIEIPVPINLLQSENEVGIKFSDAGGQIASVILVVNNSQFAVNNNETEWVATKLNISPNPARSEIILDLQGRAPGKSTIEVYNNVGQRIELLNVNGNQSVHKINIQDLDSGMYYVIVTSDEGKQTGKFIKLE